MTPHRGDPHTEDPETNEPVYVPLLGGTTEEGTPMADSFTGARTERTRSAQRSAAP